MWPATRAYIGGRDHKRSSGDHFTTVREAHPWIAELQKPAIRSSEISMLVDLFILDT